MDKYIKVQDLIDRIYPVDPDNDGSDGCTIVYKNLRMGSSEIEAMVMEIPAADVVSGERCRRREKELKEANASINEAYWVAWARDFQEPGTPENERLHTALQDVMLALKGKIHTRPERSEVVKIAKKELTRAERSLAGAKKRGAPAKDIENLEKKVAYKRLVAQLIGGKAWKTS